MGKFNLITKGLIKENPTFVLLLGMCPTLATTTSAINGMSIKSCTRGAPSSVPKEII